MSATPLRVASYLAPALTNSYRAIGDALARALGTACQFDQYECYTAIADGAVDIAFLCSTPYVALCDAGKPLHLLAAPTTTEARTDNRPVYWSDIVTRRDEEARCLEDLAGRRLGFNDPHSLSGFHALAGALADRMQGRRFFKSAQWCHSHERAIEAVLDNRIDCAAIDSHLLAVLATKRPELRTKLRVVESIGPHPIQPVVLTEGRWNPSTVRQHLVSLTPSNLPQLAEGLITGFAEIPSSAYDSVRDVLSRIREKPSQDLAQWLPPQFDLELPQAQRVAAK